jgi:hypothetical protein
MGIVIGLIVLLMSVGFVVLMMISEWSDSKSPSPSAEPLPSSKRASKAKPKKAKKKR